MITSHKDGIQILTESTGTPVDTQSRATATRESRSLTTTVKAKRAFLIRKLEKEFMKLSNRLIQASSNKYIHEVKNKLKEMEAEKKQHVDRIAKMEIEQTLMDKDISKIKLK